MRAFRVGMGAESIKELLESIDLEKEYAELQAGLENATGQKRARIVKRLEDRRYRYYYPPPLPAGQRRNIHVFRSRPSLRRIPSEIRKSR